MPVIPSIDLHVHSTFSDGKLSPKELVERAVRNRVVAMAICDHDSLSGAEEKEAACASAGVECVPAVEVSCSHQEYEVHVLGLYVDPFSPWRKKLDAISQAREGRMLAMLNKLSSLGMPIKREDLPLDSFAIGRPHLARALMEKRYVRSVSEAFARFLYDDGPVYVKKTRLEAEEGIDLVHRLGGVAILAHPGVSNLLDRLDILKSLGIDGIEVYYPNHEGKTVTKLLRYCSEQGLLVTGGTDFHAPGESPEIGSLRVPTDLLKLIRERAEHNRQDRLLA
ncbi:MAG: PHP domain-containing protein [Planctomycetota bacterium]|jgi:predicted metal-dependent phosphoesterase TrpH|nr:PHP domain-containing protein [Planctomycetota bacterium]